jgi:hypothetical protein
MYDGECREPYYGRLRMDSYIPAYPPGNGQPGIAAGAPHVASTCHHRVLTVLWGTGSPPTLRRAAFPLAQSPHHPSPLSQYPWQYQPHPKTTCSPVSWPAWARSQPHPQLLRLRTSKHLPHWTFNVNKQWHSCRIVSGMVHPCSCHFHSRLMASPSHPLLHTFQCIAPVVDWTARLTISRLRRATRCQLMPHSTWTGQPFYCTHY